MLLFINKKEYIYTDGLTIEDILSNSEEFNKDICHVTLNGKLVFKSDYSEIKLKTNDNIRILPVAMGG